MKSFAIFRLPHAASCTMIEGDAVVVPSLEDLDNQQGFLLAPFSPSKEDPIILILPDEVKKVKAVKEVKEVVKVEEVKEVKEAEKANYYADFDIFHHALLDGQFRKLVLARCSTVGNESKATPMELFREACQRYPRLFVALVSTPQSGTWLTATPEILLEVIPSSYDNAYSAPLSYDGAKSMRWHTVALAGTMPLRSDKADDEGQRLRWSAKNIQEQRYVASYVADALRQFSDDVIEEGPRTVRAAHLVHLRSDFTFSLLKNKCTRVGHLLNALHPTPAVCGLPKDEARRFIISHEHAPRHYYSGFMGPFNINENENGNGNEKLQPSTHLYVSLRCMNISSDAYKLYAGGGLLRESSEQQEWQETEAKLDTMRRLLLSRPSQ